MDVPSGNRLDVLPVIGFIQDLMQKHSAKNVLASPEYQSHYQKLMGTGEMSPQLQKWATNPYVGKALDEGIRSRVSMVNPIEATNLGGVTPAGANAQIAQNDELKLGMSSEARRVGQQDQLISQNADIHKGTMLSQMMEHLSKVMPMTNMEQNYGDLISALDKSGVPGVSDFAHNLMGSQQARKAEQMKLVGSLKTGKEGGGFTIGGVSPFGDTPPGPGETVNNFRKDEVINAFKKLSGLNNPPVQGSGATVSGPVQDLSGLPYTPPAPVAKPQAPSFSFQPTGSNVNSPSAFMQPSSPTLRDAGDVQNVMKQTQARLKAYIEAQNKIPRSSTSGIQQANQMAQQINSLAQPFTTLYNKMSEMGVQPTEEMHQLMQQLIKSGYSATQKSVEGAAPLPPKK